MLPKLPHTDENNDNYCEVCGRYTVLSGDDGSISWRYDPDTDTLIVSGTGSMRTYSYSSGKTTAPWSPFCNTVKHLVIEDGITRVGACAFYGCVLLEDVSLPDSVTYLAYNAFQNCYALQRIALSEFVTGLGVGVFYNCTGLTEIYYNAAVSGSFNTGSKEFYSAGTSGEGVTVTIGPAVESVPANLFHISDSDPAVRRPKIKTVIFENGATEIGSQAFRNCDKMTSLTLPNSIETISENAFYGCSSLTDVYYNGTQEEWNEVTILSGNDVFNSVTMHFHTHSFTIRIASIPATCTENGAVIYACGCGATQSTPIPATGHVDNDQDGRCEKCNRLIVTSGVCGDELTWRYDEETATLTITGTGDMYDFTYGSAGTIPWKACLTLIQTVVLDSRVTSIGAYAFAGCSALETINIPNSVVTIGRDAFRECTALEHIEIPGSVSDLPTNLFILCSSLQTVTLNTGTTQIGISAFNACSALTGITIPDGVEQVGMGAFSCCLSLTEITFPGSINYIGTDLFLYCENLKKVTISEGLTRIPNNLFNLCSALETVSLPSTISSISL